MSVARLASSSQAASTAAAASRRLMRGVALRTARAWSSMAISSVRGAGWAASATLASCVEGSAAGATVGAVWGTLPSMPE